MNKSSGGERGAHPGPTVSLDASRTGTAGVDEICTYMWRTETKTTFHEFGHQDYVCLVLCVELTVWLVSVQLRIDRWGECRQREFTHLLMTHERSIKTE